MKLNAFDRFQNNTTGMADLLFRNNKGRTETHTLRRKEKPVSHHTIFDTVIYNLFILLKAVKGERDHQPLTMQPVYVRVPEQRFK